MANKKRVKKLFRTRMLLFVPVCITLILVLVITIGKYWVNIAAKYKENYELERTLDSLKEKEVSLEVDVAKLQDPDYIGRYAREKFFYSKEGEISFQLPTDE